MTACWQRNWTTALNPKLWAVLCPWRCGQASRIAKVVITSLLFVCAIHPGRDRVTTKTIDGEQVRGIFTSDLTLNEVKTLKAKQRLPFRDQSFNGKFDVLTLSECIDVALGAGRPVGIYPGVCLRHLPVLNSSACHGGNTVWCSAQSCQSAAGLKTTNNGAMYALYCMRSTRGKAVQPCVLHCCVHYYSS